MANIRLGWKCCTATNELDYYRLAQIFLSKKRFVENVPLTQSRPQIKETDEKAEV